MTHSEVTVTDNGSLVEMEIAIGADSEFRHAHGNTQRP